MSSYSKEQLAELEKIESDDTKLCNHCKKLLPITSFGPDVGGRKGLASRCRACRQWFKNNRYDPNYKLNYDLKSKYGITLEEYRLMEQEQDHTCAICGTDTPDHWGRFVVDHCHETGKVRGLLCSKCNVLLGMARENTDILLSSIHYLEKQEVANVS